MPDRDIPGAFERRLPADPASREWHLDKRIPVALIVALALQAGGGLWWASNINARVEVVEQALLGGVADRERIARIEATLNAIDARLERMERMDERRQRQ